MIRRPPRSTQSRSSAASDVYKRQGFIAMGSPPFLQQSLVETAAIGKTGQAVLDSKRRELAFQVLLLRHIARDRDNTIDLSADLARNAQRGFDPDLGFIAMARSVADARLLHRAALQG